MRPASAPLGNQRTIEILTANNLIGGVGAARNVIAGGGGNNAINLRENGATGNVIQGNFIGINATGQASLGSALDGINSIRALNTLVGGTAAGQGNVISGNSAGISLAEASGWVIQGNLIGTNVAGTAAVPNGLGILLDGHNNTIGGTVAGARNSISGNGAGGNSHGIRLVLATASIGNVIQGNYIGTNITGTAALGNGGRRQPASNSDLANISTRGFVSTGSSVMIGGFISGNGIRKVIVRGLGPTLADFHVTSVLADPILSIHDANGTESASNDNWQDTQAAAIQASGFAPPKPSESAIILTRPPGYTTAIVSGKNVTTGNALVEVYNLS